jgi:integrase
MPSYLQKRRQRWYAVLEIPDGVRKHFAKKPRFIKSLETDSHTIALRRAALVVASWKKQIADAKGEPNENDATYWRKALSNAKTEEERQTILERITEAADYIGSITVENIGDAPTSSPEAQRFYAEAVGWHKPFTEHLDEWQATSRATQKTKDMQKADVNRFAAKFPMVQGVTRPEVRRWITSLMNDEGLKPKTVQRILSALRGYWRYLQTIKAAGEDDEPFSKLDVARQAKRTEPRSSWQPFKPADVVKLLSDAVKAKDEELADLIRLGMWTGCRIEELCALRVEKVKHDHFAVEDAKTKAGWREVPIHSKVAGTFKRLIGKRKAGYVLASLTENKYGDRSNAVGKRFGRLKNAKGYGSHFVFHSIRKTVVTILENAGVPENVVADIVGHEKPTMTFGLYSGGVSLAVKREALAKLAY